MNKENKKMKSQTIMAIGVALALLLTSSVVVTADENQPPYIAMIDAYGGENYGQPGDELHFVCRGVDPDSAQGLLFQWDMAGELTSWIGPLPEIVPVHHYYSWDESIVGGEVRVKCKDDPNGDGDYSDGIESEWSEPLLVYISNPPEAPTVAGATDGYKNVDMTFVITGNDPEDQPMNLQINWGDSTTSLIENAPSGHPEIIKHAYSEQGDFTIRVQGQEVLPDGSLGNLGSWSEPYVVSISINPPNIPTIDGPDIGDAHTQYEFTANTTTPYGSRIQYFFDFGDGTNSFWVPEKGVDPGQPFSWTHTWDEPGEYQVKVKARNEFDHVSAWSNDHSIVLKPIQISSITGGIGLTVTIQNHGDISKYVNWSVELVGGTFPGFHLNKQFKDTDLYIAAGTAQTITVSPVLGLGNFKITVTVDCSGSPVATKTIDGKLLFFYTLIG